MIYLTEDEKPIVEAIRQGAVTRAEISRALALPKTTVDSRIHKFYLRAGVSGLEALLLKLYPPLVCPDGWAGFSKREQHVVQLVLNGIVRTNAISEALCIAPKTVTDHLNSIYAKSGATNRAELILMLAKQS